MVATMIGLFFAIALIAGPSVLITMLRIRPIGHAFVLLTQLVVLGSICYLRAPIAGWFVYSMLALAAIVTYSLGAYVTAKADDIRPLVKESMDCVGKAKTPEQRRQCQARALEHLRAALVISGDQKQ